MGSRKLALFSDIFKAKLDYFLGHTENPAYKAPMLIGPLLKFPRYKALCQYIRFHLVNIRFKCKICDIDFLQNNDKKVSEYLRMYLNMPVLDKILPLNVNFVAF